MKIPPVSAYTLKGKLIVLILRFLLKPLHWLKGKSWQAPPPYFHDDPRHFTTKDLLFFAYKYYFKSPIKDDANGAVINFFKNNPPKFTQPESSKQPINQSHITITAAGDLMPYEWIQKRFCSHLWDDIGADFFSSDITFANLETPIDTAKPASFVPEIMLNDMLFNGSEEMFDIFNGNDISGKGFDILSTANNHSLDMGEDGVSKTIEFLKAKNIHFTGTARSKTGRLNFPIIEKEGIRIAFIAYTYSMNQFTNPKDKPYLVNHVQVNQPNIDLTPLKNDIFHAKKVRKADIVVLSLHYGNAYQAYPAAHIVENTKRIFEECGADIILGGHAHNIQPMARYDFTCPITQQAKQGFVLFSFGDFVAYDIFNWCHLSVYLKLHIKKVFYTEGVSTTFLSSVTPAPVYACGVYESENKRNLRFLDAEKTIKLLEMGEKPDFMTDWHVVELKALMAFYNAHFALNL